MADAGAATIKERASDATTIFIDLSTGFQSYDRTLASNRTTMQLCSIGRMCSSERRFSRSITVQSERFSLLERMTMGIGADRDQ